MTITAEINSREVDSLIQELIRRRRNMRPAFIAIEQEIVDGIEEIFETEGGAGDGKWPALSPVTKRIRAAAGKSGKMLQVDGQLAASVQTGNQIRRDEVIVSSNLQYSAPIHFGARQNVTRKQRFWLGMNLKWWVPQNYEIVNPPRPFMLITDEAIRNSEEILLDHLVGRL